MITELTRHGRTIAVIGPKDTVTPRRGVDAIMFFPGSREWRGVLPGVPHTGDQITIDSDAGEEYWAVSKVEWYLNDDRTARLFIHLGPTDERTRRLAAIDEAGLHDHKK